MTQLLLIRHGRSTWNAQGRIQGWADPPLDEVGLEQACLLGERLASEEPDIQAIYSSSLLRAQQTAEAIGQSLGLAVHTDARLKEHDVGQLTGLTWPEIEAQFPEWVTKIRQPNSEWIPHPGGEDRQVFVGRCMSATAEIISRHPEGKVAVVAHGGLWNAYFIHLLRMPALRPAPFQFDNASLSIIHYTDERTFRIVCLNDTAHLRTGAFK